MPRRTNTTCFFSVISKSDTKCVCTFNVPIDRSLPNVGRDLLENVKATRWWAVFHGFGIRHTELQGVALSPGFKMYMKECLRLFQQRQHTHTNSNQNSLVLLYVANTEHNLRQDKVYWHKYNYIIFQEYKTKRTQWQSWLAESFLTICRLWYNTLYICVN